MGQGVGHAAAVSDDIEAGMICLEIFIEIHLHVVELDFHTIEKCVIVGRTGRDLVEGIDHLYDTVQNALGQNETEISGCSLQGRAHCSLLDARDIAPPAASQVAESLNDDTAAQHVGQAGDTLAVSVAVLEGLGKMFGDKKGEIGVLCLFVGILKAVSVHRHDPVGVLVDHDSVGIHTEGSDTVLEFLCPVDDLALIQFIGQM